MIYIITPCSRPQNLETISLTIPKECQWVIVYDDKVNIDQINNAIVMKCEDTGIVGTKGQNHALDNLLLTDDDFILLHDDDNIIHPDWHKNASRYLNDDFSIMTWGQLHKDGSRRLRPSINPTLNHIDTACFMISWKYNKHLRHQYCYDHDGRYAEACAKNGPVLCIDKYLSFYNYLA